MSTHKRREEIVFPGTVHAVLFLDAVLNTSVKMLGYINPQLETDSGCRSCILHIKYVGFFMLFQIMSSWILVNWHFLLCDLDGEKAY